MPDIVYLFPDPISIGDRGFTTIEPDKTCDGRDYSLYHHDRIHQEVIRQRDELKAKLDKAKDALSFYGDKSGYVYGELNNGVWEIKEGNISMNDEGQRARTTLEEIE